MKTELRYNLEKASELWQAELFATSDLADVPNRADVKEAAARIRPHVRMTPVLEADIGGHHVWLKLEHTQQTGSFKVRGALNAVLSMKPRPSAVVAASGGNHGLGVCLAAQRVGAQAHIFVPETAPAEKRERIVRMGGNITVIGERYADAEQAARAFAAEKRLPWIHPFAQKEIIAGQGTLALEIMEQTQGKCDAVVCAVGGGGLLSGVGVALAGTGMRVVGVEPEGIPTLHRALALGSPVDVDIHSMTASALGASRTEALNLAIVERLTEGVVLVSDAAIADARHALWESCRLLVEPAAAAPLAALLSGAVVAQSPCIVLCGGNGPVSL
ncbi:MAG: serine/threonine dehydratase [Myxococcaceae bacterium]